MKRIIKVRIVTLYLGIVITLFPSLNLILSKNGCCASDNNQKIESLGLNMGGYWDLTGTPIDIDDSDPTKDWAYTALNYDWCTGSGTWSDPYIIENVTINGLGLGNCINISNSNVFFIIRNCTVYNSGSGNGFPHDAGIKLNNVINGILENNNCSNNGGNGINLRNCKVNTILENIVNNNMAYGILLYNYCEINIISGNTFNGNFLGIYLYSYCYDNTIFENNVISNDYGLSMGKECNENNISRNIINNQDYTGINLYDDCNHNIILENIVNNNDGNGISIDTNCNNNNIFGNIVNENSRCGIWFRDSLNNIISRNTINNNVDGGIFLRGDSDNNIISRNTLNNNGNDGIFLRDDCDDNIISGNLINDSLNYGINIISINCVNTRIYQNSLIRTTGLHASDSGLNSKWSVSGTGNYWDNHTSPDSNNDGIVDNPYIWISGSSSSVDHFPLTEIPIHRGETIHIDDSGVSAWNWSTTARCKVWCTGSGTYSDPYVINGLEIDGGAGTGILIENSNVYFRIQTCIIYNADYAIYFNYVTNGIVIENYFSDITYGIYLYFSSYNRIVGNDFYGDTQGTGINLYMSNNTLIEGNFVENHYQGIRLDTLCSENSILGNTAYNNSNYGILLLYGSNNNDVTGNFVKNQKYYDGIIVFESDLNNISENTVFDNPSNGIHLDGSSNNYLSSNVIFNNGLDGITVKSDYTILKSNNNNITMNIIHSNTFNGIVLDDNCTGITIWDNIIYENGMNGIFLAYSSFVTCYNNMIRDNTDIGIFVGINSEYNLFYENSFIGNSIHAMDNGSNNNWDNGIIGNYWDDYPGVDANDDGIGDTPYNITGTANSQDNFPIWEDGIDMIFLFVEIFDQTFSTESFNITFYIYNGINEGIDFAVIQIWWNGVEVSSGIQNFGGGLYFISLDPITVAPEDDPILLNMTITATGYPDKYFETYIAVDPDSLLKGRGEPIEGFLLTLIIVLSAIIGGTIMGLVSLYWFRRRKKEPQF